MICLTVCNAYNLALITLYVDYRSFAKDVPVGENSRSMMTSVGVQESDNVKWDVTYITKMVIKRVDRKG